MYAFLAQFVRVGTNFDVIISHGTFTCFTLRADEGPGTGGDRTSEDRCPWGVLFLATALAGQATTGVSLVQSQPVLPNLESISTSIGFLAYAYLGN